MEPAALAHKVTVTASINGTETIKVVGRQSSKNEVTAIVDAVDRQLEGRVEAQDWYWSNAHMELEVDGTVPVAWLDALLFGTAKAGTWWGGSQCFYDHPPLMHLTIIGVLDRVDLRLASRERPPAWHGEAEDDGLRYLEIVIGAAPDGGEGQMSVSVSSSTQVFVQARDAGWIAPDGQGLEEWMTGRVAAHVRPVKLGGVVVAVDETASAAMVGGVLKAAKGVTAEVVWRGVR